jgi:hypothetical protein
MSTRDKMKVEALKVETGFLIPFNKTFEKIKQEKILLAVEIVEPEKVDQGYAILDELVGFGESDRADASGKHDKIIGEADPNKTAKSLHKPKVISFDQWVNDNNPDNSLSYGKGWWDYIEFIRLIGDRFNCSKIDVVSTYVMETPPPKEELLMPVVSLEINQDRFIMKTDFGVLPPYWTLSVIRNGDNDFKTYGLFNTEED